MSCLFARYSVRIVAQVRTGTIRLFNDTTDLTARDHPKKENIKREDERQTSEEPVFDEEGRFVNPVTGERGGPRGLEPTRYGDWERKGRVSDF